MRRHATSVSDCTGYRLVGKGRGEVPYPPELSMEVLVRSPLDGLVRGSTGPTRLCGPHFPDTFSITRPTDPPLTTLPYRPLVTEQKIRSTGGT